MSRARDIADLLGPNSVLSGSLASIDDVSSVEVESIMGAH